MNSGNRHDFQTPHTKLMTAPKLFKRTLIFLHHLIQHFSFCLFPSPLFSHCPRGMMLFALQLLLLGKAIDKQLALHFALKNSKLGLARIIA